MKVLGLLFLLGFGIVTVYYFSPTTRERLRSFTETETEERSYPAYQQGKEIFQKHWAGDANAKFTPWGDDERVTAANLGEDVWMASGRVAFTLMGAPDNQPWLVVFNRRTGEHLMHHVGAETDVVLAQIKQGELKKMLAERESPQPASATEPASQKTFDPERKGALDPGTKRNAEHAGNVNIPSRGGSVGARATPQSAGAEARKQFGWKDGGTALDQPPKR